MRLSLTIASAALALTAAAADRLATSERFAFSTFREQSDRVSVYVDGYPASLHASDGYIPVPIAIACLKSGRSIRVSPESFKLIDAAGHAVPAAPYGELMTRYGKVTYDQTLIRQRPLIVGDYTSSLFRVGGTFYPAVEGRTRAARIEIPPYAYFQDVLYFPMPASGLGGVLTLSVALPDGQTMEIRFVASTAALAEL